MKRARSVIKSANVPAGAVIDRVVLEFDQRHRRRIALTTEKGRSILLDLDQTTRLGHGDALALEDGELVLVIAAPEKLIEIQPQGAASLVRIAWHLGNRHLPTEINGACLRLRDDHVIADMIQRLGGKVTQIVAPFEPEGGAYGSDAAQAHAHHYHRHGHDHE